MLSGGIYLSEKTASTVLDRLTSQPPIASESIADMLADRELQVFEMTGRGLSTREIAEQLWIDTKIVDSYCTWIKEKFNLESSSDLLKLVICWSQEH